MVVRPFCTGVFIILLSSCLRSQNGNKPRLVGGPCEGCEAVFEYGERNLKPVDTLPGFHEGIAKLKISGTIYESDGKTPAPGVILYLYHTDEEGLYSTRGDETGWGRRHGQNRGWLKTDSEGRYTFYTVKPGIYPSRADPAHIHPTLLEPDGKYYWLTDYYFKGDTLLTEKELHPSSPRGGSDGVLILRREGDLWVGSRDLILGKNIPDYH